MPAFNGVSNFFFIRTSSDTNFGIIYITDWPGYRSDLSNKIEATSLLNEGTRSSFFYFDKAHRILVEFKVLKYSFNCNLSMTAFSNFPTKFDSSSKLTLTIEYENKISAILARLAF